MKRSRFQALELMDGVILTARLLDQGIGPNEAYARGRVLAVERFRPESRVAAAKAFDSIWKLASQGF